ncbi:GIY-YIG nuclease family protein [Shewanella sp. 4t3-1-2LB]|jgi:hypothetical protein|uniref:GIY-YIG nuclease family protein n=1 Tax=Shewanella sp. 4t3-1-2LB TaxID=2817682 RepID=UPI001A98BD4C|nr:GIY-YIG nuclease family protein [Shewanella sp. 4t3-1-2LB]MBO1273521.1 GIY-YIG nuclease family protein [Shewanella sp. 4t3-1-2LB]
MSNFWRLKMTQQELAQKLSNSQLSVPEAMAQKLRPGHCIVIANWDASVQLGQVSAFAIVQNVNLGNGSVEVAARNFDVALRPNPAGRRYWSDREFFKFAPDVVVRYMLQDLFAEAFSELGQIEFGRVVGAPASNVSKGASPSVSAVAGFVYLIHSQYGYKIGKTVNIKSRTQLFAVKLPFPIELIHYAWFEDYSFAERTLHLKFASKRLEGEWFNLDDNDIAFIKTQGAPQSLAGL